ncbi:glycosyltransferase family 4 protein [Pedobacter jeongneungensis]|uniref:Glycosyltransferase family 4 protein n=1 Tax=Pedobacter jeongneungensis TaxID=947309 RepID=A0ABP8BF75_9SPHI
MRKVLHVVNISFVLPYYIGEQFTYFANKGIEFYVACSNSEHLNKYAEEKKFRKIDIPILRSINPIQDLKSILALRHFIKKNKIEIVFGHTPKGALIGIVAGYLSGVERRVYFRHGLMYETSTGLKRFLLKKIEQLTSRLATEIVCVSQSVINKSNQERLNNPKKNMLLSKGTCNGIDSDRFSRHTLLPAMQNELKKLHNITSNNRIVGYVGRLVNDKGINELIGAWKLLIKEFCDIKLLLIGPFEERDGLSSQVKDFIINEPSIIHTGLIDDVKPYYGLMDIFILPSFREGFPTVVLEASAMELAVITSKSTGCIDSIIENETGKYTEISSYGIAENIKGYLLNWDLAKTHGENGRRFVVENFKQRIIWEEIGRKFLDIS